MIEKRKADRNNVVRLWQGIRAGPRHHHSRATSPSDRLIISTSLGANCDGPKTYMYICTSAS